MPRLPRENAEPTAVDDWLERTDLRGLRRRVLRWYQSHGRDLPWRKTRDPYAVWISEIMLQQTTVATVLSRFEQFLERFPTIRALAKAKVDEVLHQWQGLGYYRRARHLHQAARHVADDYGGEFPTDPEDIARLPGLGRYTASAIASFAFGRRAPIIEANTRRLWARVTAAPGDPNRPPLAGQLWELAERVLPQSNVADMNQALMDLGSQICTPRQPKCSACPLSGDCRAFELGQVDRFPQLPPKPAPVDVEHVTVLLWNVAGNRLLITQRPADGVWGGLWEFPRVERSNQESLAMSAKRAIDETGMTPGPLAPIDFQVRHRVMHFRVTLHCFSGQATRPSRRLHDAIRWARPAELDQFAFSTPQRAVIRFLRQHPTRTVPLPRPIR